MRSSGPPSRAAAVACESKTPSGPTAQRHGTAGLQTGIVRRRRAKLATLSALAAPPGLWTTGRRAGRYKMVTKRRTDKQHASLAESSEIHKAEFSSSVSDRNVAD